MTGSFDETVALLERCYKLYGADRIRLECELQGLDEEEISYREWMAELCDEVLAEDGIYREPA